MYLERRTLLSLVFACVYLSKSFFGYRYRDHYHCCAASGT